LVDSHVSLGKLIDSVLSEFYKTNTCMNNNHFAVSCPRFVCIINLTVQVIGVISLYRGFEQDYSANNILFNLRRSEAAR